MNSLSEFSQVIALPLTTENSSNTGTTNTILPQTSLATQYTCSIQSLHASQWAGLLGSCARADDCRFVLGTWPKHEPLASYREIKEEASAKQFRGHLRVNDKKRSMNSKENSKHSYFGIFFLEWEPLTWVPSTNHLTFYIIFTNRTNGEEWTHDLLPTITLKKQEF